MKEKGCETKKSRWPESERRLPVGPKGKPSQKTWCAPASQVHLPFSVSDEHGVQIEFYAHLFSQVHMACTIARRVSGSERSELLPRIHAMLMSRPPDSCQNPSSYSNGCRSPAAASSDGLEKNDSLQPASEGVRGLLRSRSSGSIAQQQRQAGTTSKDDFYSHPSALLISARQESAGQRTRSSSANPASPDQGALEEGRRKRKEGEKKRESGKEKKERGLEAGARACSQNADMVRAGRTGNHSVVPNRPQGTKEERAESSVSIML